MPNHCEPAAGSTRTRASPALTCAPTASLNKNSGVGSVPRALRNRANCRSSVGSSAGVKPHRFIDTSSLPSSVTVSPGIVTLDGSELVSMNLWGFTPALLPTLERQFARFLKARGTDPTPEFLLSEAVGAQVRAGDARVRVLQSTDRWFGMTYPADEEGVRQEVARLVDVGLYPANLKDGFE